MPANMLRKPGAMDRRTAVMGLGGLVTIGLVPKPLSATPEEMRAAIRESFDDTPIQEGKVTLKLPVLSENGNSVPMSIDVDSPMTQADHVVTIQVFSEKNPLPNIVKYYLGPRAGKAKISSRIRLADTQTVTAIAQMSDGSLWSGTAKTIVTLAACIDLG